jgi:hypothetical protein
MPADAFNQGPACVVWHPRGEPAPPDLSGELAARSLPWVAHDSGLLAFADLCRAGDGPAILLLVEPEELTDTAAVLLALERFRPKASLWVYESRRPQRLRAMALRDAAREFGGLDLPRAPEIVVKPTRPEPAPRLRLAPAEPPPPATANHEPRAERTSDEGAASPPPPAELTDEELRMLLPGDEPRGRLSDGR